MITGDVTYSWLPLYWIKILSKMTMVLVAETLLFYGMVHIAKVKFYSLLANVLVIGN